MLPDQSMTGCYTYATVKKNEYIELFKVLENEYTIFRGVAK